LVENGITISLDEVSKNIEERDYLDTHRSISPLVQANDAIVIDNSFLTKEQQFDQVLEVLKAKFPYEN
jgi:cytidylate kinase